MRQAYFDAALAAALGLAADAGHQQGTGADGLTVVFFVVEAQVERPPVVKQHDEVDHQSAAGESLAAEAVPTPLVFEFVGIVFRVGARAVVPGHFGGRIGVLIEGGDEHGDFLPDQGVGCASQPSPMAWGRFALAVFAAARMAGLWERGARGGFANEDHATRFCSTRQT